MANSSGLAPTITAAGITAGTTAQWQAYLVAQYQAIYGADAYTGNDSQDGQFIGVIAQALGDCCAGAIAVYNNQSPATAQGAGLSSNVKINGLQRLVPTNSTATVTLVGQAGRTVTNGQVQDTAGNYWTLPATVTFPTGGSVSVTATCSTEGAITAAAGAINIIATPTYGWQSVTNPAAATAGAPVENDAALRVRQAQSVSLPSVTIFDGIVALLEQTPGVTRVKAYENNTNATDVNGLPSKNLHFIVEGGTNAAITSAIASKITPGVPTYGSQTATITSSANGSTRVINYDLPTDATIGVALTVVPYTGWNSSTVAIIQQALVSYFQSLPGAADVSYLALPSIALLPGTPYAGTFGLTALTIKKNSGAAQSTDIQLAYNEMAVSSLSGIVVTVA